MDNKQFDSKLELSVFIIDFQHVLYFGDGEIRSYQIRQIRHSMTVLKRWSNSAVKTVSASSGQPEVQLMVHGQSQNLKIMFYLLDMINTYLQEGKTPEVRVFIPLQDQDANIYVFLLKKNWRLALATKQICLVDAAYEL